MPRSFCLSAIAMAALLVVGSFFTGCSLLNSPTGDTQSSQAQAKPDDASLSIKFALPADSSSLAPSTAIRGAVTGTRVKIILQVRKPGSALDKVFTIIKTVGVEAGRAETSISALPVGVVIAKIQIENGHISGWRDFQGAGDLVSGASTVVEVSPPGSKLPADLLASALQEAIENDTIMAAAAGQLVGSLVNAISQIDVNSENPYSKAFDLIIEQIAPAGMVKLTLNNGARTLAGANGSTQLWQKTYTEILGTSAIVGVAPTAFQAIRVIRQGFDSYSLVEWRDHASLLSLITVHNNQTGAVQARFMNQGILDQVLQLSATDYLVSGFNAARKTPGIWRWNTGKNSSTEQMSDTGKNLEWERNFTAEVYSTTPVTGQAVQNLLIDGAGIITAVIRLQNGTFHTYLIDGISGSATPTFATTTPNQLPVVSITSPAGNSSFASNQTVALVASPSDSDGTISEVEFFAGSSLIGNATAAPWTFNWSGMSAGNYVIVARAYDNNGFSSPSSPVSIEITQSGAVNQAPTVSLTSPIAHTSFSSGSSVSLEATAADVDGTISKVEFYNGTVLLGSDNSAPYAMVWAQPAAGSYNLKARAYDNLEKNADSEAVSITVTPVNQGSGPELMISEIGSRQYSNVPYWIEFINKSNASINLSDYDIQTPYTTPAGGTIEKTGTFILPSFTLAPGELVVVRFNNDTSYLPGPALVHASYASGNKPYWESWGYINLRKTSTATTVDYIKFGELPAFYNVAPSPASEWSGANAPALNFVLGYSLVRDLAVNDDNTAANWALRSFPTPGATNDVISDINTDGDAIPDENEAPGKTFCGLPYYDWGARAGTSDIFVHIDYMNNDSKPLATTPAFDALRKVQTAFERRGMAIHFDTGTLFGNSVSEFCLDSRNHQVAYAQNLYLNTSQGTANAYSYKAQSMPLAKTPVFHYCLMGDLPFGSFSGLGEVNGNDFIITLGNSNFSTASAEETNYLVNIQAATIMHELGHNLGLRHGGNEDVNFKPNYISIMNYMYSNYGLPTIGHANEGDRYYYYRYDDYGEQAFARYFPSGWWQDLHNGTNSEGMVIDYSDGTSQDINQSSFAEATGFGRNGSTAVDFNGDGDTADSWQSRFKLNITEGADNTEVLKDHNDWAQIDLRFGTYFSGQASIRASQNGTLPARRDYLVDDHQEFIVCDPSGGRHNH